MPGLAERLYALLFGTPAPRLRCLVAGTPDGAVVGYATCAPELSTWDAREYLHMDRLFLTPGHRGLGLGALVMDAVTAEARPWASPRCSGRRPHGRKVRFASTTGSVPAPRRRPASP